MEDSLLNSYRLLLYIHLFGVILGFGGALISDFLFFKFFRYFSINMYEKNILDYISRLIWLGILVFTVSGASMLYLNYKVLLLKPSFLAKLITSAILMLNGLLLNRYVSPKLTLFTTLKHEEASKKHLMRIALSGGFVSFFSWSYTLFLAITKGLGFNFSVLIGIYFAILITGITGVFLFEQSIQRKLLV